MLSAAWAALGRVRVTLAYAVVLVAVAVALLRLNPQAQDAVIHDASTNLHNLHHGHLGTLIGSAFVNEPALMYVWLPGLMALLALAELLWTGRRLVLAFAVGHLGATLIVAVALTAALTAGLASRTLANAVDVGMSYGAVGVLGTLTFAIPARWRAPWVGWWLSVAATAVFLSRGDFTTVGHGVALVLGMMLGSRFGAHRGWTVPKYLLLTVAMGFGYLIIAYGDMWGPVVAVAGALGAVSAWAITLIAGRQTNSSAQASIQSDNQLSGGSSSSSPGISHS